MSRILNHVKEFRTQTGWTQEALAEKAGVSRQSIISIERGKYVPSLQLALKFSKIFHCQTDELFKIEEENHG
jgi:putative transcriptional regulator